MERLHMNKKEILEIRKLLAKENTRISRICGCYVDGHKEKKTEFSQSFLTLPDAEQFKYSDIFRKALSGTIGKNVSTLEFPLEEELDGGRQQLLLELRNSEIDDLDLLEHFYDKVIETYIHPENYLILLAYGVYDIPAKGKDQLDQFDASDYVYSFVLCTICPVELSRPGLCYDAEHNAFAARLQDWMVQLPEVGFLFPAFNDRNTDLHSLLYYSKNADMLHSELTDELLGCRAPLPAKDQKTGFNAVVEEIFDTDCDFEVAKEIHDSLHQLLEEKKDDPEPLALEKTDIKNILANSGATEEQLAHFDEEYDSRTGNQESMMAANLANTRRFEVRTPDIVVQVSPDRTDLIETRNLDGQDYLVIPMTDEIEVNGIRIHTKNI